MKPTGIVSAGAWGAGDGRVTEAGSSGPDPAAGWPEREVGSTRVLQKVEGALTTLRKERQNWPT